jgi:hypothetical protein
MCTCICICRQICISMYSFTHRMIRLKTCCVLKPYCCIFSCLTSPWRGAAWTVLRGARASATQGPSFYSVFLRRTLVHFVQWPADLLCWWKWWLLPTQCPHGTKAERGPARSIRVDVRMLWWRGQQTSPGYVHVHRALKMLKGLIVDYVMCIDAFPSYTVIFI